MVPLSSGLAVASRQAGQPGGARLPLPPPPGEAGWPPDSSSGRSGASNEPRGHPGCLPCPALPSLPVPLILPSKNGTEEPGRRTGAAFLPRNSSSLPRLRLQTRPDGRKRDPAVRRGHHWGELPVGSGEPPPHFPPAPGLTPLPPSSPFPSSGFLMGLAGICCV